MSPGGSGSLLLAGSLTNVLVVLLKCVEDDLAEIAKNGQPGMVIDAFNFAFASSFSFKLRQALPLVKLPVRLDISTEEWQSAET